MTARKEGPRTRDRLLDALKGDGATIRELEVILNRCHESILRYIKEEHAAERIHICDWRERPSGPYAAVYVFGPGKDARKPRAKPRSVICARYRANHAGILSAKRLAKRAPVNPFSSIYLG